VVFLILYHNFVSFIECFRALQRAIEQPLTNYDDVPSKWNSGKSDINRPTALSQQRQMPRVSRPLTPEETEMSNKLDRVKYDRKGLPEAIAYKNIRADNRQRTLEQIDEVLDRLNSNTTRIVHFDSQVHDEDALHPRNELPAFAEGDDDSVSLELQFTNANSYTNPHAMEGISDIGKFRVNVQKTQAQQSTSHMKQSIDRMRYFARPAGIKQIMTMVDDIVKEFND
jgi:hypothetical protein